MVYNISSASKVFNSALNKAVEKIINQSPLSEEDELIIEAGSIMLELETELENAKAALSEVHNHMNNLEQYVGEIRAKI